ncbi:MAG: C40 family peptidase [Acidobacteria bacterium]|nr:C40 family peptidase [Acidobacteriota bacterium]
MTRLTAVFALLLTLTVAAAAQPAGDAPPGATAASFNDGLKAAIERHLGRRYVWGASGMKSFDCSGFVWRVMFENGILVKRTTARKFFQTLPPVPKTVQWNFGTLVFFDDLKHVGIVDSPEAFYHAHVSVGTSRSEMNAFWRRQVYGFRRLPTNP